MRHVLHAIRHRAARLSLRTWIIGSCVFFLLSWLVFIYASLGVLSALPLRAMTGFPGGRDYLLIFQNDAERRPTGGFITSYGILKFRFGLPLISFGNVYDPKLIQKGTQPPDPTIAKLIGGPSYPGHGFRDGNTDPDFPTSARELIRLYREGFPGAEIDGIIAIDFTAFAHLVDAVGGVHFADQPTTGEGLFAAVEHSVQDIDVHNPTEVAERKGVLGQLARSVIARTIMHPSRVDDVFAAITDDLVAKHILFYFDDERVQSVVRAHDWGGEMPTVTTGDLLAIVEGNYGGMKSSRYITRDVAYDVELRDGVGFEVRGSGTLDGDRASHSNLIPTLTARAHLTITLAHRGDASEPVSGYYKSYWRIYVPRGATLVSGRPQSVLDDTAHTIYTWLPTMNPGESRTLSLTYDLPASVFENDVYRLALVRQAGSSEDPMRVSVKAPAGYTFASDGGSRFAVREYFDTRENLALWERPLTHDTTLSLKINPDTLPPRIAWQSFLGGLSTIDLRFSEPLDPASVASAAFTLADLNYRNEQTDDVRVTGARFIAPQNIRLSVAGVTEECREWYGLTIDGVSDTHGNMLQDKNITVVQWLNTAGQSCDPRGEL